MTAVNLTSISLPAIPTEKVLAPGMIQSLVINTGDFKAVEFYTTINCTGDTFKATLSMDESQDPTFATFNNVDPNFISFSNDDFNLVIDETNTITTRLVGYVGKKKYARLNVLVTQAADSFISSTCVLAKPLTIPVNYNPVTPPPSVTAFRVTEDGSQRITSNGDERVVRLS